MLSGSESRANKLFAIMLYCFFGVNMCMKYVILFDKKKTLSKGTAYLFFKPRWKTSRIICTCVELLHFANSDIYPILPLLKSTRQVQISNTL